MTHICVGNLTIISSDNSLSPGRRQAITWTNVGILLIEPLGTNFNEMLIEIHTFSFKKIHLKMSSGKWQPFYLGLNVLNPAGQVTHIYPQQIKPSLVPMACRLFSAKALSEPMLIYSQLDHLGTNLREIWIKIKKNCGKEMNLKTSSVTWQPLCLGLNVSTHKIVCRRL